MSKAVMMSIQPKWVEKILNGEKTIEVRKTIPKLKTPFKVYIYCTKAKNNLGFGNDKLFKGIYNKVGHGEDYFWYNYHARKNHEGHDIVKINGKVVAEFTCDRIDRYRKLYVPYRDEDNLGYEDFMDNGVYQNNGTEGFVFETNSKRLDDMLKNKDFEQMCLTPNELNHYIDYGNPVFLWHISDLKIYDKPKELGEFHKPCERQENCLNPNFRDSGHALAKCSDCGCRLTRPFQSWGYIEEINNENTNSHQ